MKTYRLGYCMAVIEKLDIDRYGWVKEISDKCERFILGIPDETIYARLLGLNPYDTARYREYLMATGWFEDVIVLSEKELRYPAIIDSIHPDVIFLNGEYGTAYMRDCEYAAKMGTRFVSVRPDTRDESTNPVPILIPLKDVEHGQKIVLYGTGDMFDTYIEEYVKFPPAYAVSDDGSEWGTYRNGTENKIEIKNPETLKTENPNDILIMICSADYRNIADRLQDMGYYNYRILTYRYEIAFLEEFGLTKMKESAYIDESRRVLTLLIEEFDKVCRDNGIHYYVICGSLIGVVRHKGMIPWDDDMDIAVPRKDFVKLKKIAKRRWGKDNPRYRFVNYMDLNGGTFYDCMPRLYYMGEHLPTRLYDKIHGRGLNADIEDRMFLDLYVMDNAHPNDDVHKWVTNVALKGIYTLMMGHRGSIDYSQYTKECTPKEIRTMKAVHGIGKMLPLKFLAFWYDAFSKSANMNKNSTSYIMNSIPIMAIDRTYDKANFGEGVRMPFEGIEVMVPDNCTAQLNAMGYYNYMTYPPMHARKPSHYFNTDIEPSIGEANVNGLCGEYLYQKMKKSDVRYNSDKGAKAIPPEWLKVINREDGTRKKIIFYNTSFDELLKREEDMIAKYRRVLDTFKEIRDNVALIWKVHPQASGIKVLRPWIWGEYSKLIEEYRQQGWGIYDDSPDTGTAFNISDGYYGDQCGLVKQYMETGRPVMIQNIDC